MSFFSLQSILVAIDLSEPSLNALDTAVALARRHAAKLYILHINDTTFDFCEAFSQQSSATSSIDPDDILNALSSSIYHKHGVRPKIIHATGHVSAEIIRVAMQSRSDLIVMGTYGASGQRDGFVGTNTYSVIKHANCPVLIVPPSKQWLHFKQILFPIRPITGALARYDVVSQFANQGSVLHVLGLTHRRSEADTNVLECIVEEVQDQIDADKVKTKLSWGQGSAIADDVLSAATQANTDLIVLTSALDVTTKAFFIGPHSQKIICNAKVPILSTKKVGVPSFA